MRVAILILLIVAVAAFAIRKSAHSARAPKKTAAAPAVETAPAATKDAPPPDPGFIGVILAGDWVQIEPNVSGRIEDVFVKPGDEVPKGGRIAQLDVASLRHELAVAQASAAEASSRLARRSSLARGGLAAITPEELDNARFDAAREQAKLAALQRTVADATVVAPFAGAITEQYLSRGAIAGPGRPIVRLLGKAPPRVRFAVPEEQAHEVAPDVPVTIHVQSSDVQTAGRVVNMTPEVDNASGMIYATASVSPPPELESQFAKGGLIVRVFASHTGSTQN